MTKHTRGINLERRVWMAASEVSIHEGSKALGLCQSRVMAGSVWLAEQS